MNLWGDLKAEATTDDNREREPRFFFWAEKILYRCVPCRVVVWDKFYKVPSSEGTFHRQLLSHRLDYGDRRVLFESSLDLGLRVDDGDRFDHTSDRFWSPH